MAIYRPKVVQKSKSTRSGDKEHGAEVICLHDEDFQHNNNPDYFKIKLAYNNVHHYMPVVPKAISAFLDDYNTARYHIVKSRQSLKKLCGHMPEGSNLESVIKIAYQASMTTAQVLSGCSPVLGTTGAAGAGGTALFDFPSASQSSGPTRKRKRPTAGDPEEEEEEGLTFQAEEEEAGPAVTITHDRQLKKDSNQCFCGKGDFASLDDLEKHKHDTHIGKGQGTNRKTGKPKDLWNCSQCQEECGDNRACWKYFRTKHLGLFIHYCPVAGCGKGNDQKDTIISHIRKDHPQEKELINLCAQQSFLKCKSCNKVFRSVKGKNMHEQTCGLPVVKKSCPFENCFKTYKSQERMDNHIQTVHEGKGHKCLCPVCGYPLSSQQALTNHLHGKHGQ